MLPAGTVSFSALRVALKRFSYATPGVKKTILDACAHCVLHDKKVTVEEAELLRAVAYALDIPLPPFFEASANRGQKTDDSKGVSFFCNSNLTSVI